MIIEKIRIFAEDFVSNRKSMIKLLSIIMILLLAAVLKIHDSGRTDITMENTNSQEIEAENEVNEDDDSEVINESSVYFVDISGEVQQPGVYQVSEGTRLFEVIEMAGGLTTKADLNSVNQASFVTDGEKIIIPEIGGKSTNTDSSSSDITDSANGLVNINSADKEELKTLNGIGDVMAERIIEYRISNRFKNKEDIKDVKGIGDGIYNKIKDKITC